MLKLLTGIRYFFSCEWNFIHSSCCWTIFEEGPENQNIPFMTYFALVDSVIQTFQYFTCAHSLAWSPYHNVSTILLHCDFIGDVLEKLAQTSLTPSHFPTSSKTSSPYLRGSEACTEDHKQCFSRYLHQECFEGASILMLTIKWKREYAFLSSLGWPPAGTVAMRDLCYGGLL